jgi:hypothetical protein
VDGQWVESPKAPTKDTEGRVTWGYKVVEMSWSSDSNILAIILRDPDGDIVSDFIGHRTIHDSLQVQLWVTGNWHWYLKLELRARSTSGRPGRYTAVRWHPEDGNSFYFAPIVGFLTLEFLTENNSNRRLRPGVQTWDTKPAHPWRGHLTTWAQLQ